MMLDYKQSQVIFLLELKMGHNTAETTHNINASGPGTAKECTVLWWFKQLCKGNESLENKEYSGWPSEGDNDQLREPSSMLILLKLRDKLPKNSSSIILWSFGI